MGSKCSLLEHVRSMEGPVRNYGLGAAAMTYPNRELLPPAESS